MYGSEPWHSPDPKSQRLLVHVMPAIIAITYPSHISDLFRETDTWTFLNLSLSDDIWFSVMVSQILL